jgi:hypothetical protein
MLTLGDKGGLSSHWGNIYENLVASEFYGIADDSNRRVLDVTSIGDVELPAMPGASDDGTFQVTLAEGTALMQAGVIDRVDLSGNVGKSHSRIFDLELLDGAGTQVANFCDADECHYQPPFSVARSIKRRAKIG